MDSDSDLQHCRQQAGNSRTSLLSPNGSTSLYTLRKCLANEEVQQRCVLSFTATPAHPFICDSQSRSAPPPGAASGIPITTQPRRRSRWRRLSVYGAGVYPPHQKCKRSTSSLSQALAPSPRSNASHAGVESSAFQCLCMKSRAAACFRIFRVC